MKMKSINNAYQYNGLDDQFSILKNNIAYSFSPTAENVTVSPKITSMLFLNGSVISFYGYTIWKSMFVFNFLV